MFTSLNLTPDNLDELPPKSSLPWVWFGFFFSAAFITEETVMIAFELDEAVADLVLRLIGIAGSIYWLFCVARFNRILREISRNQYPITGAEAAWKHFIPFYNLVWIFRWPKAMSDYLNGRDRVTMISGNVLGVFLLLSLLVGRFFDSGVGMTGTFIVGMYISNKLRKHIELIGTSRNRLPPLLDPSIFSRPAAEPVQTLGSQPPQ